MGKCINKNRKRGLKMNIEELKEIMEENNIDVNYDNMENKTFEELDLDSVDLMMIIFSIKEKYGIEFIMNRGNTVKDLIDRVNREIENKK